MGTALSVRRGQKTLKDLPEAERDKVKDLLRTTSSAKLREFAMNQPSNLPPRRASGQGAAQRVAHVRTA